MTGDAAKHSDISGTKGVFQANSIKLLELMSKKMNLGFNSEGKKMNRKTKFFLGATANPSAINLTNEVKKMQKKIIAGADFFQTQPLFLSKNVGVFHSYSEGEVLRPVVISTMLLKSYESSLRLNQSVPGLFVPAPILDRLKHNDTQEEALSIATDFWKAAHGALQGIHLFPMNNYEAMLELLQDVRDTLNREKSGNE